MDLLAVCSTARTVRPSTEKTIAADEQQRHRCKGPAEPFMPSHECALLPRSTAAAQSAGQTTAYHRRDSRAPSARPSSSQLCKLGKRSGAEWRTKPAPLPRVAPCHVSSERGGHTNQEWASSPIDSLRQSLAAQVKEERETLWDGDLKSRRQWLDILEGESSPEGGWQATYGGLLKVLEGVTRRGVSFSLAESSRVVDAARQRHGPDSLEMGQALGATALALLVGLNPNWRQAEGLLSEAVRIHSAWLGPRHCAVFLLTTFREAAAAVSNTRPFNSHAASARVSAVANASGRDSTEAGVALAESGVALVLVGNIQQGRAMLRQAAEVTAVSLNAGHPIPAICVALSEEDLLWTKRR